MLQDSHCQKTHRLKWSMPNKPVGIRQSQTLANSGRRCAKAAPICLSPSTPLVRRTRCTHLRAPACRSPWTCRTRTRSSLMKVRPTISGVLRSIQRPRCQIRWAVHTWIRRSGITPVFPTAPRHVEGRSALHAGFCGCLCVRECCTSIVVPRSCLSMSPVPRSLAYLGEGSVMVAHRFLLLLNRFSASRLYLPQALRSESCTHGCLRLADCDPSLGCESLRGERADSRAGRCTREPRPARGVQL